MKALFGGAPSVSAPVIEKPKPVRMPMQTDSSVRDAAARTRASTMMRQGRLSTILTDQTKATTGSSGQKLGA